ncbi:M48 family metallopeptidase [Streptomyces sp. SJL17-1]|uniref:M48 family metallopeptidase n=1 Tax=Streptomyces sp. SJL17-1 TaxID=2967223 RepID=UPI00296682E1|nr:M48 family metalloprotease [Streptomyces sp. SJL17-1]
MPRAPVSAGAFVLPSGTTVQFILLIAAVVTLTVWTVAAFAAAAVNAVDVAGTQSFLECLKRTSEEAARRRAEGVAVPLPDGSPEACPDPRPLAGILIPGASTAGLGLAMAVGYVALPRWRVVHRGYQPLTGMPELAAAVTGLLSGTGVRARVTFLADPLDPTISALAFGRAGRRQVVLSGGLIALYDRDRAAFRAVVLHELAHIRNRDIDIGFLTLIAWRTFGPPMLMVTAVAVLLAPAMFGPEQIASIVVFAVLLGLMGLLVTLLSSAVLRSRELYADARVCEWEGSTEGLRHLFTTYAAPGGSLRPTGRRGRLAELRRVHPTTGQRLLALGEGRPQPPPGFWDMAAVGAAVAFLFYLFELGPGGGAFRNTSSPTDWGELTGPASAALMLLVAVGTVVWRAAAWDGMPQARTAGLGLGLGVCVSNLLATYVVWLGFGIGGAGLSYVLSYTAVMCLAGWGLVRWLATVAVSWQPVLEAGGRPRLILAAVLAGSAAGLFGSIEFLLRLPGLLIYGSAFVAPEMPGAVLFFWGSGQLLSDRLTTLLLPLLLTGALVPVTGHALARRLGRRRPSAGFGPALPTAGHMVRLGIPAGAVAAVATAVVMLGPGPAAWWVALVVFGLAQVWAALWATRDHAPLRLARGLVAVLGCGAVAPLTLATAVQALSCSAGSGLCSPFPEIAHVRLAVLAMALTSGPAWLAFAALVTSAAAVRRRRGRGVRRPGPALGVPPKPASRSAARPPRTW